MRIIRMNRMDPQPHGHPIGHPIGDCHDGGDAGDDGDINHNVD